MCRLMESYRKDAEQHGAEVALNCEVIGGKVSGAGTQCMNCFDCPTSGQLHWQYKAARGYESSCKHCMCKNMLRQPALSSFWCVQAE